MTPKEKAKELFNKYWIILKSNPFKAKEQSVKCALITIDEIIKELIEVEFNYDLNLGSDLLPYWNDVKSEIEKL